MARSSRSRTKAALAALAIVALGASTSAHRLDEYLQAARVAIEPTRVVIDLDLTPGVAVAAVVLPDIDRDRDGSISAGEAQAYVARVLRDVTVTIDGVPLAMSASASTFPAMQALRTGVGTIQLRLAAAVPTLRPGVHRLALRNDHLPAVSAYLANALVPASDLVDVTNQRRDHNQRALDIDYVLREKPRTWWDFIFQQKGTL
jgi:hypothetical protein